MLDNRYSIIVPSQWGTVYTQHQIRISNSTYKQPENNTQNNDYSLHTIMGRKVKDQHDADSEERSQHAVTPHHNYHYHSGTTKQYIHGYVAVTQSYIRLII
jgi:hypothetical protein